MYYNTISPICKEFFVKNAYTLAISFKMWYDNGENFRKEVEMNINFAIENGIRATLPPRPTDGHKGTFGRALLLSGSTTYTGAALLASEGAFRMGAGLVYLYAPEEVLTLTRIRLPEVICRPFDTPIAALASVATEDGKGAVLVGPGLGRGDAAEFGAALGALLAAPGMPCVLDADALNMLAALPDRGVSVLRAAVRAVVLTPHPLEFARLTGKTVEEIQNNRKETAAAYAKENRVILILKGANSVIASPEGEISVNPSGSTALAKGGSGDVLAGMLTGLLAQGMNPYAAACAAAYLHGLAGERLAEELSDYGTLPSDLPRAAARELKRILEGK